MKRLNKFIEPRMISGRVEKADAEQVEKIISKQAYATLQDFINFSVQQLISGTICIYDGRFTLNVNK
jgi:hypothetical protein